ncbi:D-alanyl-D-alanine carboxypeptidase family protein [Cohnella sp. AR92]|uniref:M15 family metallopeptidase n=1 Tax=Cohnella sp. AR92 TaxID=648716 RepID=UPI000F8F23EA|nr:M15 family metallopeptidase [Cohnella sp. AR92]RUS47944.1 D-alanyl-D-alanine carboxypeptidase family protein [Cohnella sp. AR92]
MRKWFLASAFILLSGCSFSGFGASDTQVSEGTNTKLAYAQNWTTLEVGKDQVYQGDLVLVNREKAIRPEALPDDIIRLGEHPELTEGFALLDPSLELSKEVALKFEQMTAAAARDGVKHFRISSGYRNNSEQDKLFEEKGPDYALPAGHSEHNLGLSLDIGSTAGGIDQSSEGKWLKKNAWKYGFVLRYPKDKSGTTGIQYEPWHFRYVGLPHSLIMKEKNFVLEEYLAYLKEKKTIFAKANGVHYQIEYVSVSKKTDVPVPAEGRYTISGDNSGGVIVTVPLKEAA